MPDSDEAGRQLMPRVICTQVGFAKYVENEDDVDRKIGKFRRIPPDVLKASLRDPITWGLFTHGCISEFTRAHIASDFLRIAPILWSLDKGVDGAADRMAGKLSGIRATAAAPVIEEPLTMAVDIIEIARIGTPSIYSIRVTARLRVSDLPGMACVTESKSGNAESPQPLGPNQGRLSPTALQKRARWGLIF